MWDDIWIGGDIATMISDGAPYGAIEGGAVAVADGAIAWVGPTAGLAGPPETLAMRVHDVSGRWITPGLIDCHTHLVYGGNRAREFEMRLEGASYAAIAREGGGILSTVAATRAAPEDDLLAASAPRLESLAAEGVTTIEIKSGYGLDVETELKQLRVARRLGDLHGVTVRTTFLGAHALPPEFAERADDYIDFVCAESLPAAAAAGLADAVDAFCESIAFSPEQTARVFDAAAAHGLPVKLHADQLSDFGGAALAAAHHALSADHLEYTSEAGVRAMAETGTVAVLLPGAFYALRETQMPPVDHLRAHRVPIAVASDSNPGSSPVTSILLMLNMACTLFRLTPEEALAGVTRAAALALGLGETHGTIAAGKVADLCIWDIAEPAELAYRIGFNPLDRVIRKGVAAS
ncbi:MAG: imidazolonepropionase [Rhodospirillales bacterium]|nr:MAG: imidazolonepropionase [Rhodospirillales bacterium]